MYERLVLVLGAELLDGGRVLGPMSILRTETGAKWCQEHGGTLVVAATFSPDCKYQEKSMAQMMIAWIRECVSTTIDILELLAPSFDTRGELQALYEKEACEYVLVSTELHLRRVMKIAKKVARQDQYARTKVVIVPYTPKLLEVLWLEPLKLLMLYFPESWHRFLKQAYRTLFGNPSWL